VLIETMNTASEATAAARAAHIAELAARFAGVQEPQTNPLDSSAS
jgi:hypothetical protein